MAATPGKMTSSSAGAEENILVCIRIRPLSQTERKSGETAVWRTENNTIISKAAHELPAAPPPLLASEKTERKTSPSPASRKRATIATPLQGSKGATIARPARVGGATPSARTRSTTTTPNGKATPTSRSRLPASRTGTPVKRTAQTPKRSASPAKPATPMYAAAKPRSYSYSFDRLFRPSETTQEVYERMAEGLVWSAMDGFNATIFAYGQTGSGKTFTMKGNLRRSPGIIPLTVQDLFEYIKQTPEREFLLRVSYFEIYNESINDLLQPEATNLNIRESKTRGIFVEGLREEIVRTPEQCMSLLAAGESNRHISATNFNKSSSRSHTIFRVVIESKHRQSVPLGEVGPATKVFVTPPGQSVRVSALNLIDLAGSEKASAHTVGKDPKARRTEGSYINKSLLTLGNVISKLSSDKRTGHIPYRDSKLTRILETSLRGNARIAIICTISVSSSSFEESHNTLKFASRAKIIKNNARVNEFMDDKSLIRKYRNEINELKKKLSAVMESEGSIRRLEELNLEKQKLEQHNTQMLERLRSQEEEKLDLEEKINRLSKLILDSSSVEPSHVFRSMMRRNLHSHVVEDHVKSEDLHHDEEEEVDDDDDDILVSADLNDIDDPFTLDDSTDGLLTSQSKGTSDKPTSLQSQKGGPGEMELLRQHNALLEQRVKHLEAALLDKQLELELQIADNALLEAQLMDSNSQADDDDNFDDKGERVIEEDDLPSDDDFLVAPMPSSPSLLPASDEEDDFDFDFEGAKQITFD